MRELALQIGGKDFPIPTVIQHIDKAAGQYGLNILLFGLQVLITATIVLALVFLVWGGVNWVISEGDKTRLQAARKTVISSIIGLIVSLLSFAIVNLIGYFFLGGVTIFGQ